MILIDGKKAKNRCTPTPFEPFTGTRRIALRKRIAGPPCDWPTAHHTYEWLNSYVPGIRYTCGLLFKLAITCKRLQVCTYKWLGRPLFWSLKCWQLCVVHTRWPVSTRCNLTCQHRRPNGLRNTTTAACIRRQHRSPKKLDGRPILNFLRVHISELLVIYS